MNKWFMGICERPTCHGTRSVTETVLGFQCWECLSSPEWKAMHAEKPYTILNTRENYVRKGF